MTLTMNWNPILVAAIAADANNMALVYSMPDAEDDHSIVLSYDKNLEQPWGRTDVKQKITGIAINPNSVDKAWKDYVAVSANGVGYFLNEQDDIRQSEISSQRRINGISLVGRQLISFGSDNQLNAFDGSNWVDIAPEFPNLKGLPPGSELPVWNAVAGRDLENMVIVGSVTRAKDYSILVDPDALAQMSEDEIMAEVSRATEPSIQKGYCMMRREGTWSIVPINSDCLLSEVFYDKGSTYWLCGGNGQLYTLNSRDFAVEKAVNANVENWLFSIAKLDQHIYIAGDRALWHLSDRNLQRILPKVNPKIAGGIPSPLRVQAIKEGLIYFDYLHDVKFWNGSQWRELNVPALFKEREFSGFE